MSEEDFIRGIKAGEEAGKIRNSALVYLIIRLYEAGEEAGKIRAVDLLDLISRLYEHVQHERKCITRQWEAGEPTADGGYREKYAGKWYQTKPINAAPKCDCGVDDLLSEASRVLARSAMQKDGKE